MAELSPEAQRERQLLLSISSMGSAVFLAATAFMAVTGLGNNPAVGTAALGFFAGHCAVCYVLSRQGWVAAASHLLLTGSFALTAFAVHSFGGVTGPHIAAFPLIVIATALLRGWRTAVIYGVAAVVFAGVLSVLTPETIGLPRVAASPSSSVFGLAINVISAGVIIALADRQRRTAQEETERVAGIARANHDRLERLIAESPDGLAWFDAKGRLMESNPEFCRMCANSPAQLIGRAVGQLSRFHSDSRMAAVQAMERLSEGEDEQRFTMRSEEGTECIVEVRAKRVLLAGTTEAFQWTARDVTEREGAREARERLEAELQAARRLEDIGRLAGGVAHDFNNLLTAVNANAYLLDHEPSLPSPSRRQIKVIRQAGERAAALTQQLLAFARRQVLEPHPIELSTAVESIVPLLQQMLGADVGLELRLGEDDHWVEADRSQLEQVLVNLAVNGRDAMPSGGVLTIEVVSEQIRAHPVLPPGKYVLLRVTDTGMGMDEETAGRIFEPFFTTKAENKGTGLGLATVHGVVRQSGGHVSVRSRQGEGAVFEVRLPRIAAPESVCAGVSSSPTAAEPPRVGTVLVVDDEPLVRQTVESVLELAGFQVLAADGSGEVDRVLQGVELVDLLVTDVVMPGESGPALAERLRRRFPQLKILFMSGYADELNTGAWRALLPFEYLQKPFLPSELRRLVDELMASGSNEEPPESGAGARSTASS